MRSSIISLLFLGIVTVLFQACQKDEPLATLPIVEEERTFNNVPEPLWDYFERFEEAASDRGLPIDLNRFNLTAEIVEITEDGVAGTCSFGSHTPKHIEIDATFWNQSSDLFKEFVVFHELGHCVLLRGHTEDTHANGTCVSLMRSGVEGCRDNYQLNTREAYLDELFEGLAM